MSISEHLCLYLLLGSMHSICPARRLAAGRCCAQTAASAGHSRADSLGSRGIRMRSPHAAPVSRPNALPCNALPACSWIAGATEVDVSAARKAILIKASARKNLN